MTSIIQKNNTSLGQTGGGVAGNVKLTVLGKAADTARSSTTTAALDPDLQFEAEAGAIYSYSLEALVNSPADADLLRGWIAPVGAVVSYWADNAAFGASAVFATGTSLFNSPTTGSDQIIRDFGIITMGGTGGPVGFAWAQNISDAGDTKVLAGSILQIAKIG